MSLYDYAEEFLLYERVRTPDGRGGFITGWDKGRIFVAALSSGHTSELRAEGGQYYRSSQKINVRTTYTLYVPNETDSNSVKPTYDDYVRRLETGGTYRIISRSEDRKAPDIASIKFYLLTLEQAELPAEAVNELD